jgi:hypothetical protein
MLPAILPSVIWRILGIAGLFLSVLLPAKPTSAYFLEIDGTTCVNDGISEQCQESVQLEPAGLFENGLTTISGHYAHEGIASAMASPESNRASGRQFAAYAFASADLPTGMLSVLVDAHGPVRAEGRSRLREIIYFSGSTGADGLPDGLYLIGAGITAIGSEGGPSSLTFTVIPFDPETGKSGPIYSQTKSLGGGSANVFYIIGTPRAFIVDATLEVSSVRNSTTDNVPTIATMFLVLPDGVKFRSESGVLLTQGDSVHPGHPACGPCTVRTINLPPILDLRSRTSAHLMSLRLFR